MSEITEIFAKKQFNRFSKEYNKLRGTDLVWYDFDEKGNEDWDFRGQDTKTGNILPIQYTEAITNQLQKTNLEAHKRDEYSFKFDPGIKMAYISVEKAYLKKLISADRKTLLLAGFHDYPYERNRKFDSINDIREYMIRKFKQCVYKELWIINVADFDGICDFIF